MRLPTLLCLLALVIPTLAQADTAGFLVGANLARLSATPDISASTDSNFMMGAFAEFQASPEFYIEPQLRYIEKGADLSNSGLYAAAGTADVSRTIRYLELPLHFKYKFRDGEKFRPYLFAGPALAFKIGDSTKITAKSGDAAVFSSTTSDDALKSMDFSADFGGGLELFFSETFSVRFGVEYSIGLVDINETVANWHTRGLQLYAGAGFEF